MKDRRCRFQASDRDIRSGGRHLSYQSCVPDPEFPPIENIYPRLGIYIGGPSLFAYSFRSTLHS
jgi:hypothetical protein